MILSRNSVEYAGYKFHLTYIIAIVTIDLGFIDKLLVLTPQQLLDFGFLNQVIV